MTILRPSIAAAGIVALLVAGGAAFGYAEWTRPIADADRALADGRFDAALASYRISQARFDRWPALRQVFAADADRVVANELWILYQQQRYDDVADAAGRAPDGASPHLWSALAFLAKGRAESTSERQLGWLTRSAEELRRAVEAAPADWTAKYDFELVSRLAAGLRKQPTTPPKQLMQVLRPTPKLATKPGKRVG